MANLGQLDPRLRKIVEDFQQQYPDVRITSGFRDPSYNAKVGGARGSQHVHGNAFDFSVRGLDETKQQEIANWLKGQGLQGFGYYPNSQSMHADLGGQRFWGPDYTKNSLGQTPEWFRQFAGYAGGTDAPAPSQGQTQFASAEPSNITPSATAKSDTVKIGSYDVSKAGIASLLDGLDQAAKPNQQPTLSAPVLATNDVTPMALNLLQDRTRRRMVSGLL